MAERIRQQAPQELEVPEKKRSQRSGGSRRSRGKVSLPHSKVLNGFGGKIKSCRPAEAGGNGKGGVEPATGKGGLQGYK